jgi:hypothetical protein
MQEGKPARPDALRPARNFPPLKAPVCRLCRQFFKALWMKKNQNGKKLSSAGDAVF